MSREQLSKEDKAGSTGSEEGNGGIWMNREEKQMQERVGGERKMRNEESDKEK
jgi:hypothetical protein